jgi:hypothetical protein
MIPIIAGAIAGAAGGLLKAKTPAALHAQRVAYNDAAVAAARGDVSSQPAIWLGVRAGVLPANSSTWTPPGSTDTPGVESAWGDTAAKQDAAQKWNAIGSPGDPGIASSTAVVRANAGAPAVPTSGIGALVASIFGPTANTAGAAAGAAAAAQSKTTIVQMSLLAIGAVVLVIVLLNARKR